jgi:hypothetical protein
MPPFQTGGIQVKLYHLVLKDILRRKKRVLYAALGIVIAAIMPITARASSGTDITTLAEQLVYL